MILDPHLLTAGSLTFFELCLPNTTLMFVSLRTGGALNTKNGIGQSFVDSIVAHYAGYSHCTCAVSGNVYLPLVFSPYRLLPTPTTTPTPTNTPTVDPFATWTPTSTLIPLSTQPPAVTCAVDAYNCSDCDTQPDAQYLFAFHY